MIPITVTGRLGAEPELRFTKSGKPVISLRIAHSTRAKDPQSGEWIDSEPVWFGGSAWERDAEAIAEAGLNKGDEVLVHGELTERTFTGRDGTEQRRTEIKIRAIGPAITPRQNVTIRPAVTRQPATRGDEFGDEWALD